MCWHCGSPVRESEPFGRSLRCPDCGRDLRCCENCRFYRPGTRDCSESQAELPRERDRANFCDWFSLNPLLRQSRPGEMKGKKEDAKSAFEALFK